MVFAVAIEGNVPQYHHLPMLLLKARREKSDGVNLQPREHLLVHVSDAARGVPQALAPWVLPDGFQELPHCFDDLLPVQAVSELRLQQGGAGVSLPGAWGCPPTFTLPIP